MLETLINWLTNNQPNRNNKYKFISTQSCFLDKDIELLIDSLIQAWPDQTQIKSFLKSLKKLKIVWHQKRIIYQNRTVLAVMNNPASIEVWIGPRLKDGTRRLIYTGLIDQLIKLLLISNNQDPNTDTSEIRKIIANISHPKG